MVDLKWGPDGLLPVVIQDAATGEVLTLAHANAEALQKTVASRSTHLFSRSRNELWHKGATSGNTQSVVSVSYDCDADALLYRVIPSGPACHTGATTCFHHAVLDGEQPEAAGQSGAFSRAMLGLQTVLEQRKTESPEHSYVAKLYAGGVDRIGKKIGEEATEVVIAAKNDDRKELIWEAADLVFHLLVLLRHTEISLDEVGTELLGRAR
ncbi:MAG: bifunctional phosphoribosyl-AMP cyclohydrolase/phosphoribosyl-ATP diphosphatase HisIE [Candidatus Eremiobacteraeota bacterium]|nr:bifunctional phosphoribosyl-AMP cyclohydrolase/phosphoribosyl-ATP diphosphatase HisIE [Candidatus Eremiobacteraeota bacterium]